MRLKINQENFYIIDTHKSQMQTNDVQENRKHTFCSQYNLIINSLLTDTCGKENHGWSGSTRGSVSGLNVPTFWKNPFHILPCGGQEWMKKSSMLLKVKHPVKNNPTHNLKT